MKAFVAIFAALFVASASAGDHYEHMLEKWGKMKAMEGCFGEENTQAFVLKMKKAKAMCSGKPAPELDLPIFNGKVRLSNALIEAGGDDNDFGFGRKGGFMKKMFQAMMMKRFMKSQIMDLFDEDDDDDDEFHHHGHRHGGMFRKRFGGRFRRQAEDLDDDMEDDEELDLGDMMVDKLEGMEEMFKSKIGNITCILREVRVINGNNEIDLPAINNKLKNEMVWTKDREWLRDEMIKVHAMCKDLADAVPESILNSCQVPHYLTRLGHFKKCLKMKKVEACMHSDVRQKVSKHGMSVEDLAEKAGLKEEQLVPLMAHVVFGGKHH